MCCPETKQRVVRIHVEQERACRGPNGVFPQRVRHYQHDVLVMSPKPYLWSLPALRGSQWVDRRIESGQRGDLTEAGAEKIINRIRL